MKLSSARGTLIFMSQTNTAKKHHGSCHCGAVRFEVEVDLVKGVGRCNCSICTKAGATGAIVKPVGHHGPRGPREPLRVRVGSEDLEAFVL
jgi:hypothetical protein